jgi:peptidyl-prolyl cis-trans isomerase SurA
MNPIQKSYGRLSHLEQLTLAAQRAVTVVLVTGIMTSFASPAFAEERTVDAVVATVEGEPITISDIKKRMGANSPRSISQIKADPAAKKLVDVLVMEQLLKLDAAARRIGVSDSEVEGYLQELASRNNLSMEEFGSALKSEGKDLEQFKEQVKVEITKSKLAGKLFHEGVGVSDDEVDRHIKSNNSGYSSGDRVKLRQIFLATDTRKKSDALRKLSDLRSAIDSPSDFAEAAKKHSEAPDKSEGGSLGVMSLSDLSPEIRNGIRGLDEGEISQPVSSPVGFHLFLVEETYAGDDDDDSTKKMREEVRKNLSSQAIEKRLQEYFAKELLDQYVVEKKF